MAAAGRDARSGSRDLSSGLADLDRLVGGGFPLGAIVLLAQKRSAATATRLIQCFLAEGVACEQRVVWLTAQRRWEDMRGALPRIVAPEKNQEREEDADGSSGLRIAWQYKRYLDQADDGRNSDSRRLKSTKRSAVKKRCHDFDLSKKMESTHFHACPRAVYKQVTEEDWLNAAAAEIDGASVASEGEGSSSTVLRLVAEDCGGVGLEDRERFLRSVYRIKALTRGTRCCVLLCVDADWHQAAAMHRVKHICDGVLCLSPVVDTSDLAQMVVEPATLVSLLKIEKLPALGTLTRESRADDVFAVRHKRKRLSIRPVEIDPDKETGAGNDQGPAVPSSLQDYF